MRTQIQTSALQGFIIESEKNVWPLEFLKSNSPTQPWGTSLITRCQFHFRLVTTKYSCIYFSRVVQATIHFVYLPSPYWTTKILWMSQQKTLAKISMCCSYHFCHRVKSLMTEGNCFGGIVPVFLNWLVLCHPRNGFQKHFLHDL